MLNKIVLGEAEHSPAGFLSCLERLVDINCKDMSIDFYIENINGNEFNLSKTNFNDRVDYLFSSKLGSVCLISMKKFS